MSTRASCSIPVSNPPDIYDSLHVTNLALDVVSIAAMHANTSFEVLAIPDASQLFSSVTLVWSRGSYTHINFNELQ